MDRSGFLASLPLHNLQIEQQGGMIVTWSGGGSLAVYSTKYGDDATASTTLVLYPPVFTNDADIRKLLILQNRRLGTV